MIINLDDAAKYLKTEIEATIDPSCQTPHDIVSLPLRLFWKESVPQQMPNLDGYPSARRRLCRACKMLPIGYRTFETLASLGRRFWHGSVLGEESMRPSARLIVVDNRGKLMDDPGGTGSWDSGYS